MSLLTAIKNRLFGSNGKSVELVVYVPDDTPIGEAVFVSGACSKLGEWNPTGLRLRQTDRRVWQRRIDLPADQPIEFKVTRGSWETVEQAADGGDACNTRIEPDEFAGGVVRHRVERWSDAS